MKKYLHIAKINFLNNIQYFGEFFFKAVFILIILFIFTNIWQAIYQNQVSIEGFTITMMLWYLLMAESLVVSAPNVIREVNKDIQSGEIAYQLNKPYNYIGYYLSKVLSYRIISFGVTLALGAVLIFFMVGGIAFNLFNFILVLLVVLLAMILDFFMLMSLALLAFWFEDTNSFRWIYDKILFTLGGMLIPLEIFPKWLSSFSGVLPFSFVAYYPSKLFVDFSFSQFYYVTLVQVVYIVFFMLISFLIYQKGVRGLNINGG